MCCLSSMSAGISSASRNVLIADIMCFNDAKNVEIGLKTIRQMGEKVKKGKLPCLLSLINNQSII